MAIIHYLTAALIASIVITAITAITAAVTTPVILVKNTYIYKLGILKNRWKTNHTTYNSNNNIKTSNSSNSLNR